MSILYLFLKILRDTILYLVMFSLIALGVVFLYILLVLLVG